MYVYVCIRMHMYMYAYVCTCMIHALVSKCIQNCSRNRSKMCDCLHAKNYLLSWCQKVAVLVCVLSQDDNESPHEQKPVLTWEREARDIESGVITCYVM